MINKPLAALVFALFIFGCNQKGNRELVVIKYSNGVIKSEINYVHDSIRDGVTKLYYRNGHLGDEIPYRYGKIDGWWLKFNEAGIIQSKEMFRGDVQNGFAYYYDDYGKLEHEEFWRNGQVFGSSYWYYGNGAIEEYANLDFNGHRRYMIQYDSMGRKTKEIGVVIGQVSSNAEYDTINNLLDSVFANKLFYGSISVANPPNTIIKVLMGTVRDNKMTDSIELPIKDYMASFRRVYTKKGKHSLLFKGEMRDTTGILLKRDSVKVDVIVR